MPDSLRALHVSPHPDDEVIGCGGTLTRLIDAGWNVTNLVVTPGSAAAQEDRRLDEARAAASLGGYDLDLSAWRQIRSAGAGFEAALMRSLQSAYRHWLPTIVISPSPHDGHPRHEAVGRAVASLVKAFPGLRWWMYGIWDDLPLPTMYVEVDAERLKRVISLVKCYKGELLRQRYQDLVRGRLLANGVLGQEKIFGFGSGRNSDSRLAELLTEVAFEDGDWRVGEPRIFSAANPLPSVGRRSLSFWIERRSDRASSVWRNDQMLDWWANP